MLFACTVFSVSAQKTKKNSIDVSYGDEYFKNGDYFQAEQYYITAYKKQTNSSYVAYRIAECNRLLFNYTKAEEFYGKTVNNTTSGGSEFPLAKYYFAQMQKMNGKYEEANATFDQFILSFQPKTKEDETYLGQAKVDKEGCEFAMIELKHPQRDYDFQVLPIPVNSKASDYSPAVYLHDSSIVITSARENSVGGEVYDATGESFSDNLRFEKKKDGKWALSENKDGFNELVNTKYNDGAGVFTKDKKKFYYTQCDDDQGACAIYATKKAADKWSKPVRLNDQINNKGGWNAQPSLNEKGDTLYFVSKREGGFGQHDIWFSAAHKGEDLWDTARNMGNHVNTPFIEMSPNFDSADRTLFFSSTGHKGFGGLDIFMAQGDSLKQIKNMGLPFNSNKDDFYFVVGDKKGFMSSNRDGGSGNDDIYMFNTEGQKALLAIANTDKIDTLAESVSVKGKVLDQETMDGVPDLDNLLTDEEGNVLKKSKTNKEGAFRYDNLDKTKNYKVLLKENDSKLTNKSNYVVANVQVVGTKGKPSKNLFENVYFDYDKVDLRSEAIKVLDELAEYCKENPQVQEELKANTDNFGTNQYNTSLSEKRGDEAMNYLVVKGVDRSSLVVDAQGEGKPMATNANEIGRQLNRRVEFYLLGAKDFKSSGMVYSLQPKNTLYSIAKENGMTVDELKRFNGLEGEDIKAFSPIRVPRNENKSLIDPATLGIVNMVTLPYLPKSEHVVLTDGEELYTIEQGNTMFSVAKQFNMTIDELMKMNGLTDVKLVLGQKIKVRKK